MTTAIATAYPLAVDWVEAAQVSTVGFAGVFAVLSLLYLTTVLYGAIARRVVRAEAEAKRAERTDDEEE